MSNLNISEKIRKARRESDLSQSDLAFKIDVSLSTIQRIEKNGTDIGINLLRKISKELNKPMSFFVEEVQTGMNITDKEILEALDNPVALKALLITSKSSEDIKRSIKHFLECFPSMPLEKRKALLTLCE